MSLLDNRTRVGRDADTGLRVARGAPAHRAVRRAPRSPDTRSTGGPPPDRGRPAREPTLPAATLVWTAGTSPHPLVGELPCELNRGRICVNEFLEVAGWPGVWALGDCAQVPNRKTGGSHPPTAQHALRQGAIVANNIAAAIRGGRRKSFDFAGLGQLAAIGHRTGVAKIFGLTFSGFFAWWLWRTIDLSKLPRFEKKVRVALNWTLDLFFRKDFVQYLSPPPAASSRSLRTLKMGGVKIAQDC